MSNWLTRWLGSTAAAELDAEACARRDAWLALPRASLQRSLPEQRWVVVDVESTGLNLRTDRLIAIGAVSVRGGAIDLKDSFEVVLRQSVASADENILIHGIAGVEQRTGMDPALAMLDFLEYIQGDPLIAFHAFFDESMLQRACKDHLHVSFKRDWLDLAHLAPALFHDNANVALQKKQGGSLDAWLSRFDITVTERHRAVADAVATAQMWLALAPALDKADVIRAEAAFELARQHQWLLDSGRI